MHQTSQDDQRDARARWSSQTTFFLAAIGAAVGLGNIWRFPYVAGENGAGAFILIYIAAVIGIVTPIAIGELMIGRRGRMSPPGCMRRLAQEIHAGRAWAGVGWLGMATAFIILSFYSVIAGWVMAYIPLTLSGAFSGLDGPGVAALFYAFLAKPLHLLLWHTGFMAATVIVILGGLHRGIEFVTKTAMPALFVMLLGLVVYAAVNGDFAAAAAFLLRPDWSGVTHETVVTAIGQAFFSVGVGGALLMTYGTYLPAEISLPRSAYIIAGADTLVAILAGLAIFPLIFAHGLDPADGPGLVFASLPLVFGRATGGAAIGTAFFVLLALAALTSSIAVLEPLVRWAEERRGLRRRTAALLGASAAWLLGIPTILSFNVWADVAPLGFIDQLAGKTFFALLDGSASNVLLPLSGILLALFVGWRLPEAMSRQEFRGHARAWFPLWRFLVRVAAPIGLGALFVSGLVGSSC